VERSNREDADEGDDTKDGLATRSRLTNESSSPFMNQVQKGISEDFSLEHLVDAIQYGILNCLLGVASLLRVNIGKVGASGECQGMGPPGI